LAAASCRSLEAKPLWQWAQAIFESKIGSPEAAGLRAVLKRMASGEFAYQAVTMDALLQRNCTGAHSPSAWGPTECT
jgi:hypothetical protein